MKRSLQFLSLLLLSPILFQCNRSEIATPQSVDEPFAVSATEALQVAQKFTVAKNSPGGKIGSATVVGEETIYDETDQKPLFHVINQTKGFIIVSADLRTMPVLAHSNESQFDTKQMPIGVKGWFDSAKLKIKGIKKNVVHADSIIIKEWKKYLSGQLNLPLSGAKVGDSNCQEYFQYGQYMCKGTFIDQTPLLNTQWSQNYISSTSLTWASTSCGPCQRFAAGCGPVAMAQVWEFYRPDPSRPRSSDYSCTANTGGEYSLGQLMLACGNVAGSQYHFAGTCNTFTWPSDVRSGLEKLGFSSGGSSDAAYNYSTIRNELLGSHPLIFWGSTCMTCFSDYHIWVCDGLEEHNYSEFNCSTKQCDQWAYAALHMNWGWTNGGYNGWYSFGQYNPAGEDYNSNLHVISGIRS